MTLLPGAPEVSFTQPGDLRTGYYDCSYDIADSAVFTEIAITVTLNGVTVDTVTAKIVADDRVMDVAKTTVSGRACHI
jgi:hypothetical protein